MNVQCFAVILVRLMLYIKGAGWTTDKSHKCLGIDSDITVYVEYQSVWKQSEGEVYTNLGM
jgi:hypothetical protein